MDKIKLCYHCKKGYTPKPNRVFPLCDICFLLLVSCVGETNPSAGFNFFIKHG